MFPLLFIACGSDDDDNEPKQDYTSFTLTNKYPETEPLFGIVVGWQDAEGYWHRIDSIGDLEKGKTSREIKLTEYHKEIGIFLRMKLGASYVNRIFTIQENTLNKINLGGEMQWNIINDINDPKQYPIK